MNVGNIFIKEVSLWLQKKFSSFQITSDLFLIGSILNLDRNSINDVDIVQKLNKADKESMIEFSDTLRKTKSEFIKEFNLPLHITTFTNSEDNEFVSFMSKNAFVKIV